MNKNIEHYIFHKKNFLEEEYCENCINELNKCNWKKHTWYEPETDSFFGNYGDEEPSIIDKDTFSNNVNEINGFIIDNLYSTIAEYINTFKLEWFDNWAGYSSIRFNRYNLGQTMHHHCDHIHSLFDGEHKGVPVLSLLGILNDDYEGGELIICEDKKIDTKKGDLIIFPSNFLYPHKVTPVTKGVRYSYVSWAW